MPTPLHAENDLRDVRALALFLHLACGYDKREAASIAACFLADLKAFDRTDPACNTWCTSLLESTRTDLERMAHELPQLFFSVATRWRRPTLPVGLPQADCTGGAWPAVTEPLRAAVVTECRRRSTELGRLGRLARHAAHPPTAGCPTCDELRRTTELAVAWAAAANHLEASEPLCPPECYELDGEGDSDSSERRARVGAD